MTVRLLHGIHAAALRAQCLREVFAWTGQWPDKRAIILVPEQAKLDFEQAYLQQSGSSGLLMAEVLSFHRLATRLSGEAGQLTGPCLGQTGQAMLLYRLLQESSHELKAYARLADKPGFIRQIMAVLGDLRRYQVDAATLSALTTQITDKSLRDKVFDLALLMTRYRQALTELDLFDPDDELDRLASLLETPKGLARQRLGDLAGTSVWVAGFGELRNFTPQEYAILDQLVRRCAQVTVTALCDFIPADALAVELGPDLFLPGRRTAWQLVRRFRPVATKWVEPDWSPANASLARFLGAPAAETRPEPACLKQILAAQPDDLATHLAREICRLVRTDGYRYRDIIIAVCDPAQDLPRIQAVFSQHGIPLFLDQVRSLSGSALMRTVLAVLDILRQGFSRLPVMRALRAGLLVFDPAAVDEFENVVLARGLFHLERLLEPEAGEPEILAMIRQSVFQPVQAFGAAMQTARTGSQRASALVAYLEASGLRSQCQSLIDHLTAQADQESSLAVAKAWNALLDVLDQLNQFAGPAPMSLATFRDLLSAGLDNADSGVLPSALDQVAIGNLAHARQRQGKILFLYNASSSLFPPGAPPEGLLKDRDRQSLSSLIGQSLPSNARDQVFSDAAMIYSLLTLPSESLVVLAPASDPSRYVEQLAEWSGQPAELLPVANDSGKSGLKNSADLQVNIEASLVEQRFGTTLQMSVSQLEKYAACPFQHLAAHAIGLLERDIYEPELSDAGTLLHRLAEASLQRLQQELVQLPDDSSREDRIRAWLSGGLEPVLRQAWQQLQSEPALGRFFVPGIRASAGRRLEKVAQTSIAALLRQLLAQSFAPRLFEWSFGPRQNNALSLELDPRHRVLLNGIVDRIDLRQTDGQEQFRVIDYKSGHQQVNYDALYHGLQLQLPAYLAAYQNSHPGQKAADACYFHFDQPILRQEPHEQPDQAEIIRRLDKRFALTSLKLPPETLDQLQALTRARICRWAQDLVQGEFSARPRQIQGLELACTYCAFQMVCGFDPGHNPCERFWPLGRPKTAGQAGVSPREELIERLVSGDRDEQGGAVCS